MDAVCQRIRRAAWTLITEAAPETVVSAGNNDPSSAVVEIFNMAKRIITALGKITPGNTVNSKMKILHALLVAVAKTVGMRIKKECEIHGIGSQIYFDAQQQAPSDLLFKLISTFHLIFWGHRMHIILIIQPTS